MITSCSLISFRIADYPSRTSSHFQNPVQRPADLVQTGCVEKSSTKFSHGGPCNEPYTSLAKSTFSRNSRVI